MKKVNPSKDTGPQAQRIERWQAPSGRYLEPGKTFKVNGGGKGRKGKFTFIAYIIPVKGTPYVEAVDPRNKKIRCLPPEEIHTVSTKGGPDDGDEAGSGPAD